jgi:hypothetical protein
MAGVLHGRQRPRARPSRSGRARRSRDRRDVAAPASTFANPSSPLSVSVQSKRERSHPTASSSPASANFQTPKFGPPEPRIRRVRHASRNSLRVRHGATAATITAAASTNGTASGV